jgi:glyoxylase-like metal-dependent hydrolase (beta-lactamase superfamily II)
MITLVYGESEGILVDAQFFVSQAQLLADRIASHHIKLKAIFVTHPDGDHYLGLGVLHTRFPDAHIYMTTAALEEFKRTRV